MRSELRAAVVGAVVGLMLVSTTFHPMTAHAAWCGSVASKGTTNPMEMASLGQEFVPVQTGGSAGGGTGGVTYKSVGVGLGAAVYFDLDDKSSVNTEKWGTVNVTLDRGVAVLPTTYVWGCSVAWDRVINICPTGAVLLTAPFPTGTSPAFKWGSMTPRSVQHVQVITSVAIAQMTVTATSFCVTRAGMDRTS